MILTAWTGTSQVPLSLWPAIFLRGLAADLSTLAYLLSPVLLAKALAPQRIFQARLYPQWRAAALTMMVFGLLFLATAEFVFWMEFQTRFNFIALDYLIYTTEVLRNIWQSYPIGWILLGIVAFSLAISRFLRLTFLKRTPPALHGRQRMALLGLSLLMPVLSSVGLDLDWFYRQGNAFAEELSLNGLFTIAAAARRNDLDYMRLYPTIPQEKADAILAGLGVEWTSDIHKREEDPWGDDRDEGRPAFLRGTPRNIVLISAESLSASYLGAYGSMDGLTPHLDQLSKQGLLFREVYATGTRTVRGLEALALGTPPVPGQSIIRRPRHELLTTVGDMLDRQGYDVFFIYGGYSYFDNMGPFFRHNRYRVIDRRDFPAETIPMENVWGVADEALFGNSLRYLDNSARSGKRFFAHIMTTSNHRPYTYPAGRIDIPSPGGRRGAVKYTDYAIGRFIESCRPKPWFAETLFVITADHCASVAGKTEVPVDHYRIPLIFYGPRLIHPGVFNRMISQIDIPPTLLDALGAAGDDLFFGKEIHEQAGAPRAFISNYQTLGYYKQDRLILLKPGQRIEEYRVDPRTFSTIPGDVNLRLREEAIAYYQTASNAFKRGQLRLLWPSPLGKRESPR